MAFLGGTLPLYLVFAVALGVLGGYPIVSYFAGCQRNRFDEAMGKGAYGTFLVHITVIWMLQRFVYADGITPPPAFRAMVVVLSVAGGFAVYYFVERPMQRIRRAYVLDFIQRYPAVGRDDGDIRNGG